MLLSSLSFLKQCLKLTLTLCFGLFVFGLYLLFTAHGGQLLLSIVSEVSPYRIEYQQFSGYLARQAHFEGLKLSGPTIQVEANHLSARWILVDLLHATKTVQFLEAEGLKLHYHGKKIASNSAQVLLPFPFVVEDLTLKDAHFTINDDQHSVTYLQLKQAVSANWNALKEIHYRGSLGQFDAILNTSLQANWDLHFNDAPFFKTYLQGAVNSKGHILLPKRKWRDPNNEIDITLTGDQARFEGHALQAFKLTLNGTLANHYADLTGKINKIPFTTQVKGKLTATQWHGRIDAFDLHHPLYEALNSLSGTLDFDWSTENILTKAELLFGKKQSLHADLQIKKNGSHKIKGNIQVDVKQLKSLAAFFPELKRLQGSATATFTLSGILKKIKYSGDLLLSDLKIKTPFLKKQANIQQLRLVISEKQNITLTGQGMIGEGVFQLTGNGSLKRPDPQLNIHLKGEQLLLSDTPEYYIVANPDLTLSLQNTGIKLEGNIFIPHAVIKSFKNPNAAITSDDVVLVSKKVTTPAKGLRYSFANQLKTNIHILLGDNISYEGYGIKTKAQGQINIKQSPGQPAKAKGKITLVKGKYRAYGKRFDLSHGELLFTGGVIENPTLNIQAERKVKANPSVKSFHAHDTIKVGVRFIGPLKNAHIEFYSSPSLSTADIISYLVVGQPQSKMNESQAAILFEALSQLTLFSGNKRSDVQLSLAEQLKLDQFGFAKKDNGLLTSPATGKSAFEDTVFVLGKQLSDRLYLHYSIGLMDSSNNFGLRYFVNKNITLEASTGSDGSSADLLLTFES